MVYFFRPALFAPIGHLCTVGYVTHIFLYKYIISCFFFSVNQKRRKEYLFKNIYVHGKMDCSSFCFCCFLRVQTYPFTVSICHKSCVDRGYSTYRWSNEKAVMQSFLSFTSLWAIMVDMGESIGHRVWSPMRSFLYDILKSKSN